MIIEAGALPVNNNGKAGCSFYHMIIQLLTDPGVIP